MRLHNLYIKVSPVQNTEDLTCSEDDEHVVDYVMGTKSDEGDK